MEKTYTPEEMIEIKTLLLKEHWQDRFNPDHYRLLVKCSKRKDFSEWDEFLREVRGEPILLTGAVLCGAYLRGVDLCGAILSAADFLEADLTGAKLEGAQLQETILNKYETRIAKTSFDKAILIRTDLSYANLKGAVIYNTKMQGAFLLGKANLEGAEFIRANLKGAKLSGAIMKEAKLYDETDLRGATLDEVNLEGAELFFVRMEKTTFNNAIVDGSTLMSGCYTDDDTDFSGVGLGEARIDPQLKSTLEANVRRLWWIDNYKNMNCFTRNFCKFFWMLSNYGRSTKRIIGWFFGFAAFFAAIYAKWPSMISELIPNDGESVWLPLRSLYFSIVTMTTLGFGDMNAAPDSIAGHILLMFHVIIGYVLLGALIVRIGTLFTSVPPMHKKRPLHDR